MHFIYIKQVSYTLFRATISQPSNPFQLITSMNPIFFSFQVLSLNSSPFSSLRISFSKTIGADWSLSLSLSLSLLVGRDSEREEKTYCRGKRRKRDLTLTCLERACFPENNSGKQAQEKKGNYYMAFPLTNLSFPLTHIFLCNHTEMFNPIFFSFQVLSLNSSPFLSPRISLSKKIGADWFLSLSLSLAQLVERVREKRKLIAEGREERETLPLHVWRELVFRKIIVENRPKKRRVIIIWLFH